MQRLKKKYQMNPQKSLNEAEAALSSKYDESNLEIPAFLRRQRKKD